MFLVYLIFEMPPRNNRTFLHKQNIWPWPAKFPDLSPLDYWLRFVYLVELRKNPLNYLPEPVNTVETHAACLNKDQIITAANDILPRAQA